MKILPALLALTLTGFSGPALAQSVGFDPAAPCVQTLTNSEQINQALAAAWALGYRQDSGETDIRKLEKTLDELSQKCLDDTQKSLVQLLDAAAESAPGSEADARALLMRFLAPDADLAALVASLKPDGDDVRRVYKEPLAGKLLAAYNGMYTPGVTFGPKPGQSELRLVYTTTGALRSGDAALAEFPGGYKKLLDYFNEDVPIVRFKFVEPGETLGLAFDGLVFVNNHWVLMPKPWRQLD